MVVFPSYYNRNNVFKAQLFKIPICYEFHMQVFNNISYLIGSHTRLYIQTEFESRCQRFAIWCDFRQKISSYPVDV